MAAAVTGPRPSTPGACAILGVGPGLGASLARVLVHDHPAMALLSRTTSVPDSVAAELAGDGRRTLTAEVDLADVDSVRMAMDDVRAPLGWIELLVVNGAAYSTGGAGSVDPADLVSDFRTNVVGAVVACQTVLPDMRSAGRGTILLTGGGAALYPSATTPALSITKAGLRAYCYSLFDELRGTGVHATTITIEGGIGSRPRFDPARIAEAFRTVHHEPPSAWTPEVEYRDDVP